MRLRLPPDPEVESNGAQIHPDWILGTNLARHGCIRLSQPMSLRLWDFTTHGHPGPRGLTAAAALV